MNIINRLKFNGALMNYNALRMALMSQQRLRMNEQMSLSGLEARGSMDLITFQFMSNTEWLGHLKKFEYKFPRIILIDQDLNYEAI